MKNRVYFDIIGVLYIEGTNETGRKMDKTAAGTRPAAGKQGTQERILSIVIFCAAVYLLFSEGFAPDKMLYGLDTFAEHLPFSLFVKKAFTVYHQLPVWMPDILMGVPLIASANAIVFYPTSLLFAFLPVPLHTTFLFDFVIHMFVAALGMKLFLERTGADKLTALFGGFVYMLCGIFVSDVYSGGWIDLKAIALIPFILYFLRAGITEQKAGPFLSAALVMGLQVLALGMQIMCYSYICYAAYFVFFVFIAPESGRYDKLRLAAYFAASTVMLALFSAPQFFPTAGYMKYSWRTHFTYADFTFLSFHPAETVSFILPQAFGLFGKTFWGFEKARAFTPYLGLIPLFFIFFSFMDGKLRKTAVFFSVMSGIFLLLSFGGHTPVFKLLYHVPVFNKFRDPGRFLAVLSFTVIAVAGIGLNNFISLTASKPRRGRRGQGKAAGQFKWLAATTALLAGLTVFLAFNRDVITAIVAALYKSTGRQFISDTDMNICINMIRQDALYLSAVFILTAGLMYLRISGRIKSGIVFICLLCAIQFADMYRIDSKFISYKSMDEISGDNPVARVFQNDRGVYRVMDLKFLWFPNRNLYYDTEFYAGYHGVLPYRWDRMLTDEAFYDINVERAFNIKYHMYDEDLKLKGLKKIIDGPIKLYEDPYYKQRLFFVDRIKKAENDDQAISFLKSGFDTETAIVLEDMPFLQTPEPKSYIIGITKYTPNIIQAKISVNKPGLLILSNLYFPEWKSKVDGVPAKVYNANYANMGVAVTAGKHKVEFYYDLTLMYICFALMALAFLIYISVIVYEIKSRVPAKTRKPFKKRVFHVKNMAKTRNIA